ncbi:putative mitochondrial P-type H -ATPase, putative (H1A-1) [Leptomonas pyrrhocoris]|uniref:Plasma membrane ATPase n=1 Tax=Leptomonas pyrrhocoris TaxID=157538 RepID=A0A0M9FYM2_LEPPY|nr:putative mitochondrial P-type H -ATPase, putative (H1A-1) [Leptomonas pyrrhocoris]KPA78643.1 putative mitochondrial P-type H -ATPase, putative (H1A-1) [Leptomonas pyrrhocoris]|eukprot:XP_015657082.1 putative mitochondrial P-type H -ATPase, putative (H1A-1) [Leptomonas pyrrhocoris]
MSAKNSQEKEPAAFEDKPKSPSDAEEENVPQKPQRRQSVLSKAISEHEEDATGPAGDLLPPSKGLTSEEAEELLEKYGRNELPEKKTPSWVIYVRGLWGPMPAALWVAIIIEFALENWPDGAILFAIQIANATIGWFETIKAGDAVAALKNSLKPVATAYRDGKWQQIDAAVLVPGDLVKLAAGSAVPADCSINEGIIDVDEAALTGESLPVTMGPEHMPKMGSNVVRGEVEGTVQLTGALTFFGKTAALLQSVQSDLGNIHVILGRVMISLCAISFVLCMCCFIYLLAKFYETFRRSLQFAVVVLVVSIPIALEIVVTTTLAVGSTHLSKHKIIVTKLSAIEMMSGVNMLCSDKTGTLTLNKMEIQDQCFTFEEGNDLHTTLVLAALAAKWREPPRDALDTMVLGAANLDECDNYKQLEFVPFDPTTKRTAATLVDNRTGEKFNVTKGAPHVILQMVYNQDEINDQVVDIIDSLASRGIRCLAVAKTDQEGRWHMAGILTFLDPPRPDTKETIRRSKEYGVDVKMITGDHVLIAKEMCRMLNLDPNILTADKLPKVKDANDLPDDLGEKYGDMMLSVGGFAQVFPEHKFMIVEALRQRGFTCAMTGDGVNDAPALKRADVGIAVHGATDAARAAADMVLTEPGLSVVVEAMLVSREVFQRMLSFLTYRISATLQLVCFFFIACFSLTPKDYGSTDPEFQFFHLPVLMFMLITLLNDGCLMTIGYDHVVPSERPQKWNLPVVFVSASILSAVACGSSLMLLWVGLEGYSPDFYYDSWFRHMGLAQLPQGKLVTLMYLKISISDFLTLFSSRTGGNFFFYMTPSPILFCGAIISLLVSTMAAAFWHKTRPDEVLTEGLAWGDTNAEKLLPLWVWIYCIVWWLVQDIVKVIAHIFMDWIDLFGCVSDTAGSGPIKPYDDGVDAAEAEKAGAKKDVPPTQQHGTAPEKAAPEKAGSEDSSPVNALANLNVEEGSESADNASPVDVYSPPRTPNE